MMFVHKWWQERELSVSFPCCDCPSHLHPTLYPQNKASALRLCMTGILPMMLSPLCNTQSGLGQLVCSSLLKPTCTGPFPRLWFCSVSPIWNALHKCFSLHFPQNLVTKRGFEYKSFIWELVPENNGRGVGKGQPNTWATRPPSCRGILGRGHGHALVSSTEG